MKVFVTDLLIMSSRCSEESRFIRCYSVSDPTLHPKGHTVYKVVEKKLDVEAFDEAVQESVSWKRYNEFYKLYLALSSLHASLHRKEEFPDFPKPQIFHRFDAEVIRDRMQSAQDLLNFIGQRKYLVESKAFKEFFQDLMPLDPGESSSILKPVRINSEGEANHRSIGSVSGGIGNREPEDFEQVEDIDDDDFEDESSFTEDDDYDEFDDYGDYNDREGEIFGSSYDAFSDHAALSEETQSLDSLIDEHCMTQSLHVGMMKDDFMVPEVHHASSNSQPTVDSLIKPHKSYDSVDDYDDLGKSRENLAEGESEDDLTLEFSKSGGVKKGFLKKSFFPVQAIWKTGKNLKHLLSASFHGSLPSSTKEESKQVRRQKLLNMLSRRTYIVEAAQSIKEAKLKENSGLYGDAFDLYKSAIGTMLSGVQSDTNTECIEFVRAKISRYLTKAEELYKVHLQCHEPYLFMPSSMNRFCRDISFLRGSANDLEKFKVIGVVNKVMLVVDESSLENYTYVMKVYAKTSSQTRNQMNIVPSCVPFMVRPLRFYETETAIYVLLPHVASGTLWSYAATYLQHSQTTDSTPDIFEDARFEVPNKSQDRSVTSKTFESEDQSKKAERTLDKSHLKNSDLFFEAANDFNISGMNGVSIDKNLYTSKACHLQSPLDGDTTNPELDFHEILKKNVSQCLSMFSINSSEGEGTPGVLNGQTLAYDSTFLLHSAHDLHLSEINREAPRSKDSELLEGEVSCSSGHTNSRNAGENPPRDLKPKENDMKSLVKRLTLGLSSSCSEISRKDVPERPRIRTSSSTFEELDLSGRCRVQASNKEEFKRRNLVLLPDKHVRLWAAELVVAISSLHECGIICRDLNPDNILIDSTGHILLTYFCQWTTVERKIKTSAVDDLYCAPELSSLSKVTQACDWWSFGVILFELLAGMSLKFYWPCGISPHAADFLPLHLAPEAQSLLKRLIVYNPSERIGTEEIKSHPFFLGIDWNALH